MTTYRYKGMTSSGAEVEGLVEAFDKSDALVKAKENCRVLVSVEPVSGGKMNDILNADIGDLFSGGKIKAKTLTLLCSQLSIELRAGLPLVSALKLVAENEEDKKLKKILTEVADDVHAGNGLADAFATRGPGLPRTFIETVRAGEESGKLDETFARLQTYYEKSAAVGAKVASAMTYPIMLISVAVLVIAIIMVVAVPVFEKTFADMGNELPGPTKILIAMSNFMVDNWLLLVALIAAAALGVIFYGKTEAGSRLYARIALSFPGLGLVNKMNAASQFATTFSTMLASGLPLVSAARITANTSDNLLIQEDIEKAVTGVVEGNRLADGLKESQWFPQMLLEMVTVGEETGKLEDTLNVVSDYYTKEVDQAVKTAMDILNPIITIVLALMVVFILLSVYLPIFGMYG